MTAQRPSAALGALAHRNFRVVFIGAFLSNVGTWMRLIVFTAYAYNHTHSAAFVGQIAFANLAPVFVIGIPVGLLLDRIDRRLVLLAIAGLQALLSCALAVAVSGGGASRVVLLAIAAGLGVTTAASTPGYFAILPALVGPEDLAGAISLNSAAQNASRVVGPVAAGLALSFLSASQVF